MEAVQLFVTCPTVSASPVYGSHIKASDLYPKQREAGHRLKLRTDMIRGVLWGSALAAAWKTAGRAQG